jgi:hypothetical protein
MTGTYQRLPAGVKETATGSKTRNFPERPSSRKRARTPREPVAVDVAITTRARRRVEAFGELGAHRDLSGTRSA